MLRGIWAFFVLALATVFFGLPVVLLVTLVILLFSRLLPERRSVLSQFADAREYTVEMLVEADSPLVGTTIEDAGLRQLPGMYLVEIDLVLDQWVENLVGGNLVLGPGTHTHEVRWRLVAPNLGSALRFALRPRWPRRSQRAVQPGRRSLQGASRSHLAPGRGRPTGCRPGGTRPLASPGTGTGYPS